MATLNRRISLLNVIALVALIGFFGLVFFYAPSERSMGNLHRLLYVHVGTAWAAAITFFVALVCGWRYLRTRDEKWDMLSLSSVEVGVVLFTMTIAAGSIWGRPAWNTWWIWSPRLIGVTVTWLTYIGYFVLRGAIDDHQRRARFAAIYVFIAFATVLVTYTSVRFLRDIHPVVVGGVVEDVEAAGISQGESEFSNGIEEIRMVITLNYSFLAFTLVYVAWMANRYRLEKMRRETERLKARTVALLNNRRQVDAGGPVVVSAE